jgi:hypothetical protein
MLMSLVTVAANAAPAFADPPGLPRTYSATPIETPNPIGGGAFGWGIASADLTGAGHADLLVAQAQTGPGQVFIYDGVSGKLIRTQNAPENNPDNSTQPPTLAFVYVETMPDIGSCPGGQVDQICPNPTVGPPDGIPEILVGSRNLRVNATDGAIAPTTNDPRIGRAYVIDGKTGAVLKRIDMPAADRALEASLNAAPQFGRVTSSLQGMPPCAGSSAENNAVGVGPCPITPPAVRIGDVNGDGFPDIIITARSFLEKSGPAASGGTAEPGSQCASVTSPATCSGGRAWVYSGKDIAGSDPQMIDSAPLYTIKNPDAQTAGSTEFGGNVYRVGDVTGGIGPPPQSAKLPPDGIPDFVIPSRNAKYPLKNPDPAWPDVGVAYLYSGATGKLVQTIPNPVPQPRTQFSGSFNGGRAVGDLGASTIPDILLPSALQSVFSTSDGAAFVFNGDQNAGGGGEASWHFATLTDPHPHIGGNFGSSFTGVGDLVGGPSAPANEVMLGSFSPFDPSTEATNGNINNLYIMNPQTQTLLQTIPDPGQAPGSGFGVGVVPMGDLNGDGFLDYAASAYLYNGIVAGQGRAYIITSDNSAPPVSPTTPVPLAVKPPAPVAYKKGTCANNIIAANGPGTIRAPAAGRRVGFKIFGRSGNKTIYGSAGDDCIDAGTGNDIIHAGTGNVTILGGSGNDVIYGGPGHNRIFGQRGNDRILAGTGTTLIDGGSGNDWIFGGPAHDQLIAGSGDDVLVVGSGSSYLDGGTGNSVIYARNGKRDTINCGRGDSVAIVDPIDKVINCQHVLYSTKPPRGAPRIVIRSLERLSRALHSLPALRAGSRR